MSELISIIIPGYNEGKRILMVLKGLSAFCEEHFPQHEIERIVQVKGLEKFTENTFTNKDLLLEELEKVVQYGYAVDNMEHEEGVRCVGAPIRNNEGEIFASISVSGPSQRITTERIPEIATGVISTARDISSRLGYKSSMKDHDRICLGVYPQKV